VARAQADAAHVVRMAGRIGGLMEGLAATAGLLATGSEAQLANFSDVAEELQVNIHHMQRVQAARCLSTGAPCPVELKLEAVLLFLEERLQSMVLACDAMDTDTQAQSEVPRSGATIVEPVQPEPAYGVYIKYEVAERGAGHVHLCSWC
jgi:hypothetical protein